MSLIKIRLDESKSQKIKKNIDDYSSLAFRGLVFAIK